MWDAVLMFVFLVDVECWGSEHKKILVGRF